MKEQVGKVTLDYSFYPGEDFYCDGSVEDELLSIVTEHTPSEFGRIIEEKKSWPILYHLSSLRGNIVEWYPLTKNAKVLEVGSGCGAITATLAKKAGELTCIDLSKKRSLINANRNRDCENVTIHVGNFQDVEPSLDFDYDVVFLIGVLEYGQLYIDTQTPYEDFMKILYRHVKPGGQIVVAIENKFGLKYWAGCREDHLGTFFAGMENYNGKKGIRTFTRAGLEDIFKGAGLEEYHFYYPYPDYKFMVNLYSDAYLPKKGELSNNLRNFDRSRLLLFDEKQAFDGILEEGLFPLYSNSYLVVIGKDPETKYVKYSNDRKESYCIKTQIEKSEDGSFLVKKYPMSDAAMSHIKSIHASYEKLSNRYENSGLSMNVCKEIPGGICFEFLHGKTLEEQLDHFLEQQKEEAFEQLIQKYLAFVKFHIEQPVSNLDFIFSNILIENDVWTVIDYEWTKDEVRSEQEIAFRAFYNYLIGAQKRRAISFRFMEQYLGIKEQDLAPWLEKEVAFQKEVTGNRDSMVEIRDAIGCDVLSPVTLLEEIEQKKSLKRIQIYEDFGQGFSEEHSYFVGDAMTREDEDSYLVSFRISVQEGMQQLRIDPAFSSCLIEELSLVADGKELDLVDDNVKLNCDLINGTTCAFATMDPNIVLNASNRKELTVSMKVTLMPKGSVAAFVRMAEQSKEKNKGFRGLFK